MIERVILLDGTNYDNGKQFDINRAIVSIQWGDDDGCFSYWLKLSDGFQIHIPLSAVKYAEWR